ncbi:hypothetical protein BBO99_00008037 [Phytophthora kernoviae]|uniref:Uncharacterized protein n=1 Tax=Phytophthora kernoviae TaxID=325452 RepID=A0A3R7IN65_9STRA|nr:hypothetical protein BBI17_007958 [Phytophthora kernoviae]RLN75829.1 hypothetical protein BBO99_00008037 [Phytophthora kernoviae]
MMMRYAKVLPDGTFVKPKSDKLVYLTMVQVRAYLIKSLGAQMGAATTIATRFSAARLQGRTPDRKGEFQVLDYQNQQHALFPLIAVSYAAYFAGVSVVEMHDSAVDIVKSGSASFASKLAELHAVSSGLKAWLATKVSDGIESCRRLCGGHGFTQSSNLAHIFAEIVALLPSSETSTMFLNKTKAFSDIKLRCKAQTPRDFGNLDLLLEAFQVRGARIVFALASQMKATKNDGNACMVLMTRASTAHAELLLLDSFIRGVKTLAIGPEREAVANLCSLFGAWLITKSLGDFRQHDYLSSNQADFVRDQVVRLLPIVRKNCVLLTDAWDFSDFELNSTIGRYDGDIYRALVKRAADEPLNASEVPKGYEEYLKPLIQSVL